MTHQYLHSRDVTAPQDRWALHGILYDEGPRHVAIALGDWDERPAIGMRWNGSDVVGDMGNPQSSGHPTWFILPSFAAAHVLTAPVAKLAGGDRRVDLAALRGAAAHFPDLADIP